MKLIKYYVTNNIYYKRNVNKADSRYTTFQRRGPLGLMLHSVGCSQPSAEVFARQWNSSSIDVAVHAVLQADGAVYQCLPWTYRGIHCAGAANNTHIGVEMTEPNQIKYTSGASFKVLDLEAAQAQARGTYTTAVELFAQLCKEFGLDPLADGVIISHHEGYLRGVASNHGDPEHLWRGLGLGYTMDGFRKDVKAAMTGGTKTYTVGWHQDSKGWWYADSATTYYRDKWARINDKWYYFDKEGYMMSNTWRVEAGGDTYYLGDDGAMVTNADVRIGSDGKLTVMPRVMGLDTAPEYAKETLKKLVDKGILKGTSEGDVTVDLGLDTIRALVLLDRAGMF